MKSALVTAVADPTYQGIVGKNVVFSSLSALQIEFATEDEINEIALGGGAEAATGTDGVDVISGVSSALSSARTFDSTDTIVGGDGSDTLSLTMNGSHEFTTGEMSGVERVILTNGSAIGRDFAGTNVEDVDYYKLVATEGRVSLSKLAAAGITVDVVNHTSGNLDIAFAAAAVSGSADELTLGLANVGTGSAATPVYIDGIEKLNIVSSGSGVTNKLNLVGTSPAGANDVEDIVVTGDAKGLTLSGTLATINTIDASASTGTFSYSTLTAGFESFIGAQGANTITSADEGSTIKSVIGGAGNDSFTLKIKSTTSVATIDGGEGTDTLTLSGTATPVRYTVSGIETISISNTSDFTYDGSLTSGVTKFIVGSGTTADQTISNYADADLLVDLAGANANSANAKVTTSNTGVLSVTATQSSTATSAETNAYDVTASKASSLIATIGDGVVYDGDITASLATEVNVSVPSASVSSTGLGSGFSLTAPKAESVTVDSAGIVTSGATITAAKAAQISVSSSKASAGGVSIAAAVLEVLNIASADDFTITGTDIDTTQVFTLTSTKGLQTVPALVDVASYSASGTGTSTTDPSGLAMGNLGDSNMDYPMVVSLSGFKQGVGSNTGATADPTAGPTLTSTAGVTLDISGATGTVYMGAITGGTNVTINGSGYAKKFLTGTISGDTVDINIDSALSTSTMGGAASQAITTNDLGFVGSKATGAVANLVVTGKSGTSLNVDVAGGLSSDQVKIVAIAGTTSITVSGDLDLQNGTNNGDVVSIDGSAATGDLTITASGLAEVETVFVKSNNAAEDDFVYSGSPNKDVILVQSTDKATLTGGAKADAFMFTAGAMATVTSVSAGVFTITTAATDLDVITDFSTSDGDAVIMQDNNSGASSTLSIASAAPTALVTTGNATVVRGSLSGNSFTYSASGSDALYMEYDTVNSAVKAVLLQGAGDQFTTTTVGTATAAYAVEADDVASLVGGGSGIVLTGLLGIA